jgi:hypothetical protein
MITSSANEMNKSWPYVTITDFTSKAKRLSALSGAYQIGFSPIVYPEDFDGWTVHSYLNLPKYYEEAIKVNGYEQTVDELLDATIPFPWHYNQTNPHTGPQPSDPMEPEIPIQLLGLRERIGFDGHYCFSGWLERSGSGIPHPGPSSHGAKMSSKNSLTNSATSPVKFLLESCLYEKLVTVAVRVMSTCQIW